MHVREISLRNFPMITRAVMFPGLVVTMTFTGWAGPGHVQEIRNGRIIVNVAVDGPDVLRQNLSIDPASLNATRGSAAVIESDGDFGLDVMYTDWRAPGKQNNADNPVLLTKEDFDPVGSSVSDGPDGSHGLTIRMKGREIPMNLAVTYSLLKDAFYVRRKIEVSDTSFGHHFLRAFLPVRSHVSGITRVVKDGAFGQPVVILAGNGGAFFGLESPASQNHITEEGHGSRVTCEQEVGSLIGRKPLVSEWVVEAVTPDTAVRKWFFAYLDDIMVAPLRPYTLYNSWYDLRSPEYPRVPADNVMSESSVRKMIALTRTEMIENQGMQLDAFVLDDGWDVYKSDWVLRKEQFPHGLSVLADELKETNTSLGLWIGPIGGYSFRGQRVGWMKEHGYEVVGDEMCVGGTNYHKLLKNRIRDFAGPENVGYFKWDGIQFSCSEPGHGHPIDIYSRRAILDSVIDLCRTARSEHPGIFLNITSGTWLSPWWLKYANTIWMDGADYGYADVPSISKRDAAITYRDFVLYEDFTLKGLWFPISNLMTHGLIKGKLEYLGTPREPLDKFTDDAMLYVARGISMYELYVSPDIISEGEWNAIAKSIAWARDRFPVLMSTTMIGGNPLKREPYGYVHFKGSRGIIAARNPFIEKTAITFDLSSSLGFEAGADSLVLERVYPTRWISSRLYKAGAKMEIPLDGYETAVYEVYPIGDATMPLLAGVIFDGPVVQGPRVDVTYHPGSEAGRLLNPRIVQNLHQDGSPMQIDSFNATRETPSAFASGAIISGADERKGALDISFILSDSASATRLSVLLTPNDTKMGHPTVRAVLDGKDVPVDTVEQEGPSQWYSVSTGAGKHRVVFSLVDHHQGWKGTASVWLIGREKLESRTISYELKTSPASRMMPPEPWPRGQVRRTIAVGTCRVSGG